MDSRLVALMCDPPQGKPENQNHAIIFCHGEVLQAIDMNQDNHLCEAYKLRNVLSEFEPDDQVSEGVH